MFASVEGWMIRGLESVQQEPRSEIVIFLQTQVRDYHILCKHDLQEMTF